MPAQAMPTADVTVDASLVRALVAAQHPEFAALEPTPLAHGWDNTLFRLGPELLVRLPRRQAAAALVLHEQQWLPVLAGRLPLEVPVPVRCGVPGQGYPYPWTITRWLPGSPWSTTHVEDVGDATQTLGGFVRALHQPAPSDAPQNPVRGVPLATRDSVVRQRVEQLRDTLDAPAVLATWEELVQAPVYSGPPLWLHGDLHPHNVLVDGGRLRAVVDFGDVTAGDPATDLAVAYMAFPAAQREAFFSAAMAAPDGATLRRARGWALLLGLAFVANGADHPALFQVGRQTLDRVLGGG